MRRKPGPPAKATSMRQELDAQARGKLWRECCASSVVHRFDCAEVPKEQRGAGPFGPVQAPTAAELIARMRRAR